MTSKNKYYFQEVRCKNLLGTTCFCVFPIRSKKTQRNDKQRNITISVIKSCWEPRVFACFRFAQKTQRTKNTHVSDKQKLILKHKEITHEKKNTEQN